MERPANDFKRNCQIPIVKYEEINLRTSTELNEEYEFSNYEFAEDFGRAFSDYQNIIKMTKKLTHKLKN